MDRSAPSSVGAALRASTLTAALLFLAAAGALFASGFRVTRTGGALLLLPQGSLLPAEFGKAGAARRALRLAAAAASSPTAEEEADGECEARNDAVRKDERASRGGGEFVFLGKKREAPPFVVAWEAASLSRQRHGGEERAFVSLPREALDVWPIRVEASSELQSLRGRTIGSRRIFVPLRLLGLGPGLSEEREGDPSAEEALLTLQELTRTAAETLPFVRSLGLPLSLSLRVKWRHLAKADISAQKQQGGELPLGGAKEREVLLPLTSSQGARDALRSFLQPRVEAFCEELRRKGSTGDLGQNAERFEAQEDGREGEKGPDFSSWPSPLRICRMPDDGGLDLALVVGLSASAKTELARTREFCRASPSTAPLPPLQKPPPPSAESAETAGGLAMEESAATTSQRPPYRLISLYKLFDVANPQLLANFFQAAFAPLGALGRIYVASEGVNAQMAIPLASWSAFLNAVGRVPGLERIQQEAEAEPPASPSSPHQEGLSSQQELKARKESSSKSAPPQLTVDCDLQFSEYWDAPPFDTLHIRVRRQVLRDGFDEPLDWSDCGEEVSPSEWHKKLAQLLRRQERDASPPHPPSDGCSEAASEDASSAEGPAAGVQRRQVLLDMRNADEFAVGRFRGARCIDTPTFADTFLPRGPLEKALAEAGVAVKECQAQASDSQLTPPADVEALIYCTGGIRCVKAGAYLKQRLGVGKVTRLKGGIIAYKNFVEKELGRSGRGKEAGVAAAGASSQRESSEPPFESMFLGSNFLFDHRMSQAVTDDALGVCDKCRKPAAHVRNCKNRKCGRKLVLCVDCLGGAEEASGGRLRSNSFCDEDCQQEAESSRADTEEVSRQRRLHIRFLAERTAAQKALQRLTAEQLERRLRAEQVGETAESGEDGENVAPFSEASGVGFTEKGRQTAFCLDCEWSREAAQTAERSSSEASTDSQQRAALAEASEAAEFLGGAGAKRRLLQNFEPFWSGALKRRVLAAFSRVKKPRRVLELGAFTGLSALALAEGLDVQGIYGEECDGRRGLGLLGCEPVLLTVEKEPKAAAAARRAFSLSPFAPFISVVEGEALLVLQELQRRILAQKRRLSADEMFSEEGESPRVVGLPAGLPPSGFDLIFVDADKRAYEEYVDAILSPEAPLLAPNGVLLIDNTLWKKGWVAERGLSEWIPQQKRHLKTGEALTRLRKKLKEDTRVNHVGIPVDSVYSVPRANDALRRCILRHGDKNTYTRLCFTRESRIRLL